VSNKNYPYVGWALGRQEGENGVTAEILFYASAGGGGSLRFTTVRLGGSRDGGK